MTKFWFYHCVRLVAIGLHIKLYYLRTKLLKAATVTSIEEKPNRGVYVLCRFLYLISAASDVTQWPSTVNLKLSPSYTPHLQETCTKLPAKSFKFGVILLSPLYTSDRVNPVFASWLSTNDAQYFLFCFSKAFTFQTHLLLPSFYVLDGCVYIWLSCTSGLFCLFLLQIHLESVWVKYFSFR